MTVIGLGAAILWVIFMAQGKLPFDIWMSPYWGAGYNPPSINFMVYSLLVLFVCYSVFSLLSEWESKIIQRFVMIFSFFGENTLYTWFYHLLIISFLANKFPDLRESNIILRLVAFGLIVTLPVVIKQMVCCLQKLYYMRVMQCGNTESIRPVEEK